MTVYSRILSFRIDHTHDDHDLKSVQTRRLTREILLDEHFWTYCKRQVDMAKLTSDRRCRFPGARIMTLHMVQDLYESAQESQKVGKALSRPINTPMVLFSQLPNLGPGFDESYAFKLYLQQKRLRRAICEEVLELMVINRHIQYDEGILPEDDDFWKLSDTTVEAINHMQFLLMATNYPIRFDL